MIRVTIILVLLIFVSCAKNKETGERKSVETKNIVRSTLINSKAMADTKKVYDEKDTLSARIDKVEILCLFFGKHYDNSFRIFLLNSTFNVVSADDERDTIYIGSYKDRSKLIKYVNQFYIDKTNEIVSSVESKKKQVETDYPFIRVTGWKEKAQVFRKDVTLRNDIKFNSEFLEFYEFLNSLLLRNKATLSKGINRVEISGVLLDENSNASSFKLFLNNDRIQGINYNNEKTFSFTTSKSKQIDELIKFVNKFYIDKEKNIILKPTEKNIQESFDFSCIRIKGYKNGKKVIDEKTLFKRESNEIKYAPEFLNFHEFLLHLITIK